MTDIITDSKIITGGGSTISSIFIQNETIQDDGTVNRLIETCAESQENLRTLYYMFKKSIFAVAFSITSDYHLSEDCVSETFIRLTQVRNFNPKKGDGKGYIHKIARNVALELRRSHKHNIDDIFVAHYGETDETLENSIYINQLLEVLNDKQRQIVVMKCCSGLTFKEIAKIMKCPETTVKSRYQRAISLLKKKAGVNGEK